MPRPWQEFRFIGANMPGLSLPYDGKGFTPENVVEKTREFLSAVQESGTAGALLGSVQSPRATAS